MPNIRSVKRTFDILNLFHPDKVELGITEVAQTLGVNKSTASRLMTTLESVNIVRKHTETHKYRLDKKILDLARVYILSIDLKEAMPRYLKELSEKTGELILFHILKDDKRFLVDWVESTNPIRLVLDARDRYMPLHAGAPGKLLLAYLSDKQIKKVIKKTGLPRYTKNTITSEPDLIKEINKVRKEGVATSYGEQIENAATVAAPVKNSKGDVVAVMSISWLEIGSILSKKEKNYEELVKDAAARLSRQLGYRCFQ